MMNDRSSSFFWPINEGVGYSVGKLNFLGLYEESIFAYSNVNSISQLLQNAG